MKTLGELLGTAARIEVLRVLTCQPHPLGLRHLARRAGIHPRSAELALKSLVNETLVNRTQTDTRALYEMNRSHPDVPVIEAVFAAAAHAAIRQRNASLQAKARRILPFIDEATRMLASARGGPHVA